MQKVWWSMVVLGLSTCLSACHTLAPANPPLQVQRVAEGILDCFPAGLRDPKTQALVTCEASAVLAVEEQVLIASDKPVPGGSPFFSLNWQQLPQPSALPRPWLWPAFVSMGKTEAMTLSVDGRYALASTAFDRLDNNSNKWDNFNQLLIWPVQAPEQVERVSSSLRDGIPSSLPVHDVLQQHLGHPYFKVEGLMALPDQKLVFGIRELGANYKNFAYTTRLLEVGYAQNASGQWVVQGPVRTLLDFDPHQAATRASGLGLSSLEYDAQHHRIYILTSHEDNQEMGAYLWSMSESALKSGAAPQLVRDENDQPFHFKHKAEGLAVLKNGQLFVVHDDDRQLDGEYQRQAHQAVYSVLRVVSPEK